MTSSLQKPYTSDFLRILSERGFIHQCTDLAALDARLCAGPVAAYNGFDLTADSVHVGHLIPIMMLRWLQKTGHKYRFSKKIGPGSMGPRRRSSAASSFGSSGCQMSELWA